MAQDCEICRGREVIRLPLHKPVRVIDAPTIDIEEHFREFPCPECAPKTDETHVTVLHYRSAVDDRAQAAGAMPHILNRHAHGFVEKLIRDGYIKTREMPVDRFTPPGQVYIHSRIGVVAAGVVASIEQRATEKALEIVDEVVKEAQFQVDNWGSYYGRSEIIKSEAGHLIEQAGKIVAGRRRKEVE